VSRRKDSARHRPSRQITAIIFHFSCCFAHPQWGASENWVGFDGRAFVGVVVRGFHQVAAVGGGLTIIRGLYLCVAIVPCMDECCSIPLCTSHRVFGGWDVILVMWSCDLFGAKKLRRCSAVGRGMKEFRKASGGEGGTPRRSWRGTKKKNTIKFSVGLSSPKASADGEFRFRTGNLRLVHRPRSGSPILCQGKFRGSHRRLH